MVPDWAVCARSWSAPSEHLHNLRRLGIRDERSAELHLAFMLLGCAVVCQRRLAAS